MNTVSPQPSGLFIQIGVRAAIKLVAVQEIAFINCNDYLSTLFLSNGEKCCCIRSLKSFAHELGPYGFLRIHHHHLINSCYVTSVLFTKSARTVTVLGKELPVSKRKAKEVRNYLLMHNKYKEDTNS